MLEGVTTQTFEVRGLDLMCARVTPENHFQFVVDGKMKAQIMG